MITHRLMPDGRVAAVDTRFDPAFGGSQPPVINTDPPEVAGGDGLVQGLTDGSCVVRPLAMFNNPGGVSDDAGPINDALQIYPVVRLGPWTYKTATPVVVPAQGSLIGPAAYWSTPNDLSGFPSPQRAVIVPSATFSGSGVIEMTNTSASVWTGGQRLEGFVINGVTGTPANVAGIYASGGIGGVVVRNVTVYKMEATSNIGLQMVTSGLTPDGWRCEGLLLNACTEGALVIGSDHTFVGCRASENFGDGWIIEDSDNSRWVGCKGDNNTGYGWHLYNSGAHQTIFTGCSSQYNTKAGWSFSGPGAGIYLVDSATSYSDGNAGGWAGFYTAACTSRVVISNSSVRKGASGPQYGAEEISASFGMTLTGCYLEGVTAATYDDASNTHPLVNNLAIV